MEQSGAVKGVCHYAALKLKGGAWLMFHANGKVSMEIIMMEAIWG